MIKSILDTELEYVRCFSKEINNKGYITFFDYLAKDLYSNNITIIDEDKSMDEIIEIIVKELNEHKKQRKGFLNAEIFGYCHSELLFDLGAKPSRIDELDFMVARAESYEDIDVIDDINIVEATSKEDYQNLVSFSVEENSNISDKDFIINRIERKVKAYKESKLKVFIAYKDNRAIGSCELLVNDKTAKVEDFGVLKEYRGQGIGSYIIREALKVSKDLGVTNLYVVTSSSGRAKNIYKRCNFRKIGEKSQIIFDFD